MMGRRRPTIPPRRRVFLGCEGASEIGYGALLQQLSEEVSLHIHIELHDLGGGDPLAIVEAACRKLSSQIRRRGDFEVRALLLDNHLLGQNPTRDDQIEALAQSETLLLVWQQPCHEALLLRHLPNCQSLRPQNPGSADARLRQEWPGYQKPMSAKSLLTRIGLAELTQAATVEQDLGLFLSALGF